MPIEFACPCGKAFKVADAYAGKRSKCTACGLPVVVPSPTPGELPAEPTRPTAPPPTAEESAEDAALRALLDDEPAKPAAGGWNTRAPAGQREAESPPPPPRATAPAADAGSHAARALASAATQSKASKPSKPKAKRTSGSSYDQPAHRGWSPNWLKVGGGALGVLIGGGLLLGGLAVGRLFIWSPIIILVGIFGIINGLLSRSGDA